MPPVHMLFVGAWFLLGTGLYGLMIARNVLKAVIALQIMVKAAMLILVVAGAQTGQLALGQSLGITVIVADTAVHDMPNSEQIADIAEEVAGFARRMGYEPRVAMLAYSTFGHPQGERSERVQEAVKILDKRRVDFEYDGEMGADVALNHTLMQQQYPFCRLSGPANVLVMPAFHSASISTKMLQELGGSTVIGPLLVGLNKPVQIVGLNAKDSDIVNMAALAAFSAGA